MVGILAVVPAVLVASAGVRADAAWAAPWLVIWGVAALARPTALSMGWTVGVALVLRAVWTTGPPHLSDDVWRLLWEGKVLNAGLDPFASPPEMLAHLDSALAARVNHPEMGSIYPPYALGWFRLLDGLGGTLGSARMATVAADVLTVALLHRRVSPKVGTAWAMLPFGVVESAHGAHLDLVALPFAVLAVTSRVGAGWAVVGAGLKVFPVVLIPSLLRSVGLRGAAGFAAAVVGGAWLALPVWNSAGLSDSLSVFAHHWSFNGLLFRPLAAAWGERVARGLVWAIAAGGALGALGKSPTAAWRWLGTLFVVTSPVVHPWYVVWAVLPDLAWGRGVVVRASVFLMGSYAVLSTLRGSNWSEPPWLWWVTWGPAVGVVLVDLWRRRRA